MSETEATQYLVVEPSRRARKLSAGAWLAVAAIAAGGLGVGTYASFTASTTNDSNFSTGALILSNRVAAGTTCFSSDGGLDTNANAGCDKAFDLSVKKPGDSGTQTLDLKNEGTIPGSKLRVYAASCSAANAAGETYNGTGDPCTKVAFYLQEYPTATDRTNDTNPSQCWYGGGSPTSCAVDYAKTLTTFASTYSSTANGVDLGAFNQGVTRYFKVYVELDPSAGNNLQGRAATIPLSWYLVQ
jgi:hypothetical protein